MLLSLINFYLTEYRYLHQECRIVFLYMLEKIFIRWFFILIPTHLINNNNTTCQLNDN